MGLRGNEREQRFGPDERSRSSRPVWSTKEKPSFQGEGADAGRLLQTARAPESSGSRGFAVAELLGGATRKSRALGLGQWRSAPR